MFNLLIPAYLGIGILNGVIIAINEFKAIKEQYGGLKSILLIVPLIIAALTFSGPLIFLPKDCRKEIFNSYRSVFQRRN